MLTSPSLRRTTIERTMGAIDFGDKTPNGDTQEN